MKFNAAKSIYRHGRSLFFWATLCVLAVPAAAQDVFPSKPIRMVVPTSGGTVDLIARYVAPKLQEAWGQPVVVEQRAGASGGIAATMVSQAPADGYTIIVGFNPLVIGAVLRQNLPYDIQAFEPLSLAVSAPQVLVVNADVPANTVQEFVALAKDRQGGLNYASISAGSASHLAMELFKTRANVAINHVPYKGAAPAVNDLLGHIVEAAFFVPANVIAHVKSGRLKALAVTGDQRMRALPDVPSLAEAGYPKFDASIWIGFLAPPGTPADIVNKYGQEIQRALNDPALKAQIEAADFVVEASSPEEFRRFIASEMDTWRAVAAAAGVRLD